MVFLLCCLFFLCACVFVCFLFYFPLLSIQGALKISSPATALITLVSFCYSSQETFSTESTAERFHFSFLQEPFGRFLIEDVQIHLNMHSNNA